MNRTYRFANPDEWKLRDYIKPLIFIATLSIGGSLCICDYLDSPLNIKEKVKDSIE